MGRLLVVLAFAALAGAVSVRADGSASTTRFLAMSENSKSIGSSAVDGSGFRQLLVESNAYPAATDNGAVVATAGAHGLVLYDLMNKTKKVVGHGVATVPAWSGDETQLAYEKQGPRAECVMGFDDQIWAVNANGTNDRELLGRPYSYYYDPTWSSDGTWLVYDRTDWSSNCTPSYGLYEIQLSDPADERKIEPHGTLASFAPRGDRIAYIVGANYSATGSLRVANVDGSGSTTVLSGVELTNKPLWSPDASQIAVPCSRGGKTVLCVVTVATRAVRTVPTFGPDVFAWIQPTEALAFPLGRARLQVSATRGRWACDDQAGPESCHAFARVSVTNRGPDALTVPVLTVSADHPVYVYDRGASFDCSLHEPSRAFTCGPDPATSSFSLAPGKTWVESLQVSTASNATLRLRLHVAGQQLGAATGSLVVLR